MRHAWRAIGAAALVVTGGATACGAQFTNASGTPDGGEAGVADGAAPDVPAGGFCVTAGTHFFCDDFDNRAADPGLAWDRFDKTGAATASLATDRARSAPNAFSAKSTMTGAITGGAVALLSKKLDRVKEADVAFDLYVDQFGSDPVDAGPEQVALIAALTFGGANNTSSSVALGLLEPNVAVLVETYPDPQGGTTLITVGHEFVGVSAGAWNRIELEVVPSNAAAQGRFKVTINGQVAVQDHLTIPAMPPPDTTFSVGLSLGSRNVDPALWSLHFDNVVLDHQLP